MKLITFLDKLEIDLELMVCIKSTGKQIYAGPVEEIPFRYLRQDIRSMSFEPVLVNKEYPCTLQIELFL